MCMPNASVLVVLASSYHHFWDELQRDVFGCAEVSFLELVLPQDTDEGQSGQISAEEKPQT